MDVEPAVSQRTLELAALQARIAELEQANALYRAEVVRYRQAALFLSHVSDAVVATDPTFKIMFWNQAAEAVYGWPADEVIGRPLGDVLETVRYLDNKTTREQALATLMAEGRWSGEVLQRRRDGSTIMLDAAVRLIRDEFGTTTGIVTVNRDISGRKNVEEALEASESRLRVLLLQVPAVIWTTDRDLTCTSLWGGIGPKSMPVEPHLIGRHINDFLQLPDMNAPGLVAHLQALEGTAASYETERADYCLQARIEPLVNGQGQIIGCIGVAVNITERKHDEQLLRGQRRFFRALATGQPLPTVLRILAETFETQLKGGLCAIKLLDAPSQTLQYGAAPNLPPEYVAATQQTALGPQAGSCGTAAFRGTPVIVADVASHPLWADDHALALAAGLRACWAVPFKDQQGQVLGTFAVYYREPRLPTAEEQHQIENAAHLASVAVERRHTEATLREREALYRLITENSSDLIALTDLDGRWLYLSPSHETVLGYPTSELLGKSSDSLVHPDDVAMLKHAWRKLIEGEPQNCVFRYRHRDNVWRWFEARGTLTNMPERSMVISVGRDVTERMASDLEIRLLNATLEQRVIERTALLSASEARYRTLTEAAPQIIWLSDAHGAITYFNKFWYDLTGRSPGESLGMAWLEAVHPEDRPHVYNQLVAANEQDGFQGECRVLASDYTYRTMSFVGAPVRDVHGQLIHWVCIKTDITDRKRAEEALAAVNQELEAFAYSVSHDLRAPVRHISSFTHMLESHANSALDTTAQHYLQVIEQSAQRMSELIDGLLALARASRTELLRRLVDLNRLVRELIPEITGQDSNRLIEWEVAPLPTVTADPRLLRQVLHNLLSNAFKYTAPRKVARIMLSSYYDPAGMVVITVSDNGVGFDMQYVHKLFGVFQRLHSVQDFPGTGIGLATVRRIIHRHGGQIWAEGTPGQGAVFAFSLPIEPRA